jgi:signal transduction histidine kinase
MNAISFDSAKRDSDMTTTANNRVLLIDDMPSIHEDFRKILCPDTGNEALGKLEATLFEDDGQRDLSAHFELDSAFQGQQGLAMVEAAIAAKRPYALAFVDMRMPPGWDGVETIEMLWKADPQLQVVICTAYADHSWNDLLKRLDVRDRLLIVKKPFDMIEVSQLARSLTAKWSLARAAAEQMDRLEQAVERRTRELSVALDAAQAASRAKGDFLANMSHEIRTPLNGIMGLLHLALKTDMTPRQRDYLDKAQASSKHLLALISDVLDFSKIEAGHAELEYAELSMHQLLGEVADLLVEQSSTKGLGLAFDVSDELPAQLVGDALRLRQILLNLAGNAVKFTETGEIVVRANVAGRQDGRVQVRCEVQDTGIGISADQVSNLFSSFEQADASITRRFGGTGLGLAISKRLVEMMGGEIGVRSAPGHGSTFWFTAWLQVPKSSPASPPRMCARARVLLVEDNENKQMDGRPPGAGRVAVAQPAA